MKLTNMVPMLNVNDIETSLDFYRKARDSEMVGPKDLLEQCHWGRYDPGIPSWCYWKRNYQLIG